MAACNAPPRPSGNDATARNGAWRRHWGDDWGSYEALPPAVRSRVQEHAYDAWGVNLGVLWRLFRRRHASSARAERTLLNHLDRLEAMERDAFDAAHRHRYGLSLPHVAAAATVLRRGGAARG